MYNPKGGKLPLPDDDDDEDDDDADRLVCAVSIDELVVALAIKRSWWWLV